MKQIKYLLILLLLTSCNNWLDVSPRTQSEKTKFFENQNGFKDALIGVYINLKNEEIYGANLSMTTIEYPAALWTTKAQTIADDLKKHDYSTAAVESTFERIYYKLYNAIAELNSILGSIDERKSVFKTDGLYEIIKGESLALRAYLHFDLLRLFGPVPTNANSSDLILAYVTKLTTDELPHTTYDNYVKLLLEDLSAAEKLLEKDPIIEYDIEEVENPGSYRYNPTDTYMAFRKIRMNYYALVAFKARVNLYLGNNSIACEAAKVVINAKNSYLNSDNKFKLGTGSDIVSGDYIFSNELIFSLSDHNLVDKWTKYFKNGVLYNTNDDGAVKAMFGPTGTDRRELYMWQSISFQVTDYYTIMKYYSTLSGFIPMIRLSELYFIIAETAPQNEANEYLNYYYSIREREATELPVDPIERRGELIKEYRRDLYAEGQLFYALKRINAPREMIMWTTASKVNYILPLPKTELITKK